ncbi:MAG: histidinol dehydrogenase [Deltaproteobacteria bacterium RIFCSPLOWO2_12_FULL_43_16]|nr:MAG: histidinol dehydrogenase [Deltaproteobacteria bacterium GWA2_43_19]OGQ12873.1 MAG: histidinol dehydrogenase [Deltaproteobacteria bacterium RIFCSPHIGHO2_02_FULL_43_33]OGQ36864.1 MAG: histidinol dehydrogenase [Deltaproteobacteria bacterium RIFCSPLOWO2_01_FULL_42_9]OGQ57238.1 MAG: histidinol dehydrogenase [Deltaproteobacteria bacterium RIFCSPLOWO2_12_FULL_43_16]HBR17868.1 histidinol dehydrogenase [Deltaproteobacteria bacterium]
MRIFSTNEKGFIKTLGTILKRGEADTSKVEAAVKTILNGIRQNGDKDLLKYTERFDGVRIRQGQGLRVNSREIQKAIKKIPKKDLAIIKLAATRIEKFHKMQVSKSWAFTEKDGTILGQRITPLERVGIYVPGGKAVYPSTVLMNTIPAKVAGVRKIVMVTPPSKHGINLYVLAAAHIAGVDEIYQVGGAQAIAALAYGTETIPRVDKIVGPGNIYVATAKRLVFGIVDIDMIAGPSEILVINDGSGEPSWVAADLLSQAEHDELASGILLTTSRKMAEAVAQEVSIQIKHLKRQAIARGSIDRYGAIIITKDLNEAADISNQIAPEHLELFVRKPFKFLQKIKNAGAIFLGFHTPEALGDYMAGPNHTLPTGGTARFSSPLGVEDFIKRSSVLAFSTQGLKKLGRNVARFAEIEGLEAHGKSVLVRITAS